MLLFLTLFLLQDVAISKLLLETIEKDPDFEISQAYGTHRPLGPMPNDESELNNLGYQLLRQNQVEQAHQVFQLNTELFPASANTWDSLAYWYKMAEQVEQAIKHYRMAFERSGDAQIWQRLGNAIRQTEDKPAILTFLRQTSVRFPSPNAEDAYLAELARQNQLAYPLLSFQELQAKFPQAYLWQSRQALGKETDTQGWQKVPQRNPLKAISQRVDNGEYPKLNAIVIVRNEQLVAETYYNGGTAFRPHDVRSVGKSITALLVGIAIDQGKLTLDTPLFNFFPGQRKLQHWRPEKDHIQIRHLLAMRSGLDANVMDRNTMGQEDRYQERDDDWLNYVLALDLTSKPGEKLVYASANYFLLGEILQKIFPEGMDSFARRFLFEPLGITDVIWFYTPRGRAYGAGGIRITARDLAKIGTLVSNGGTWQGKRLVSKEFIQITTEPKTPDILWQKTYGFGWYQHQQEIEGTSYNIWQAAGNGGNRLWIVPKANLVVSMLMSNYNRREQRRSDELFREVILPSLVKP